MLIQSCEMFKNTNCGLMLIMQTFLIHYEIKARNFNRNINKNDIQFFFRFHKFYG